MFRLSLKYRLYPTSAQETTLKRMLSMARDVYNSMLHWRKHDYEVQGKSPNYWDQANALPAWKKAQPELCELYSQVLQDVCKRVDRAFDAFFRRIKEGDTPGFPRFKGKGQYDSLTYPQSGGFRVGENSVSLSKIGCLKAVIHRPLPGTPKTCTLRRQAGKWWVCIVCDVKSEPLPNSKEAVGIDMGLNHFAITSEEEFLANPRFFRQEAKALAKAQRKFAAVKNNLRSQQRHKAKKVIARVHERIRNRRHDFVHQLSRKLVNRYGLIAVEKLSVENMMASPTPKPDLDNPGQYLPNGACAKSGLNKSIGDAAWTMFRTLLSYKAESAGRKVVDVNPAFTSQDCSGCGERVPKTLQERWHTCPNPKCGVSLHRDINAAINILKKALGQQSVPASTG